MSKYVRCRIVHLGDHESWVRHYRLTCSEEETRVVISSLSLPASRDGGRPPITMEIVAELLDGQRLTSVCIEVEPELWPMPPRRDRGGPAQTLSPVSLGKMELS